MLQQATIPLSIHEMEKTKAGRESKHHKKGEKQQEKKLWKLYMGGVPVSLTEDQLGDILCEKIDNFKVHIMKNAEQGNSKGCGFIEVYTREDFDCLIKNKIFIDGKELQIEQYIENEDERKKKMFENNERSVHVGGLPLEADADDLTNYFAQFGEVKRAYIIYNLGEEKKSRGFGFVEFVSKKIAKKVLQVEHKIMDKLITVTPRHSKKEIKSTKGKDSSSKNQSVSGSSLSSKNKPVGGAASSKASSKNGSHQTKPFEFYPSNYKPTAAERGLHERFSPYMREVDGHYYLVHPHAASMQQQAYNCHPATSQHFRDHDGFHPHPQPQQADPGFPEAWDPHASGFSHHHFAPVYGNKQQPSAPPRLFHPHAGSYGYFEGPDAHQHPPVHPMDYHKKYSPHMDAPFHAPSSSFSQKSYGQQLQLVPGYGHPFHGDLQTTKSQPNKPTSKPDGYIYDARNGIAPVKPKRDAIKPASFLTPNIKHTDSKPLKAFEQFSFTELTPNPKQSPPHLFESGFPSETDDRLNEVFDPDHAVEDSSEYNASMEKILRNIDED